MYQHSYYRSPRRRREKREWNVFEDIIANNFPDLGKDQEEQRAPNKITPKKDHTKIHCIIKMAKTKDKERLLKVARKSNRLPKRKLP